MGFFIEYKMDQFKVDLVQGYIRVGLRVSIKVKFDIKWMFNVILGFIFDFLNFQIDIYYYYYLLLRIENKFFLFMYVNKI